VHVHSQAHAHTHQGFGQPPPRILGKALIFRKEEYTYRYCPGPGVSGTGCWNRAEVRFMEGVAPPFRGGTAS